MNKITKDKENRKGMVRKEDTPLGGGGSLSKPKISGDCRHLKHDSR